MYQSYDKHRIEKTSDDLACIARGCSAPITGVELSRAGGSRRAEHVTVWLSGTTYFESSIWSRDIVFESVGKIYLRGDRQAMIWIAFALVAKGNSALSSISLNSPI